MELRQRLSKGVKIVASVTANDNGQNFCSDAGVSSRAVFGLPAFALEPPSGLQPCDAF